MVLTLLIGYLFVRRLRRRIIRGIRRVRRTIRRFRRG